MTKKRTLLFSMLFALPTSASFSNESQNGAINTILFQCIVGRTTFVLSENKISLTQNAPVTYQSIIGGRATMTYPMGNENAPAPFVSSYTSYSGGGETRVLFERGGYTYILYDRMTRTNFTGPTNDTLFEAGIVVKKSGRTLRHRRCHNDATISWKVHTLFPSVTFVPLNN